MASADFDEIMKPKRKCRRQLEFGDFQTPRILAAQVCALLASQGIQYSSVIEPNCGRGSFLLAAIDRFPRAKNIVGIDIRREYVDETRSALAEAALNATSVRVLQADFFEVQWETILRSLPDPLLILGNPPWVTNADLGLLGSSNLPPKSNSQRYQGLDAMTGKSNFDISEWMITQELDWISGREAILAMLCKTSVARKVLREAWNRRMRLKTASIYCIDAFKHFGVSVDACLLVIQGGREKGTFDCHVFDSLEAERPTGTFGYRNTHLVSSTELFDHLKHLEGKNNWYKWRSGIKHDCSKVMELREENSRYRNGFGELVELENDYLYPMLKSSDVARSVDPIPSRWMLVTQRSLGEDTRQIELVAPKTWNYLMQHADYLDRRSSSIYRSRPRFSIFGVGDYSLANWKVAISGLYKKLAFRVIGPYREKPVVLDDTCYFVACQSEEEATFLSRLLNSEIAREFFSSLVFWDEKRPVTQGLLSRLDILALARELDLEVALKELLHIKEKASSQLPLFKLY